MRETLTVNFFTHSNDKNLCDITVFTEKGHVVNYTAKSEIAKAFYDILTTGDLAKITDTLMTYNSKEVSL